MSEEPDKVEEPSTPYVVTPQAKKEALPVKSVRHVDDATFAKVADKIFSERKELLRKLAQ